MGKDEPEGLGGFGAVQAVSSAMKTAHISVL